MIKKKKLQEGLTKKIANTQTLADLFRLVKNDEVIFAGLGKADRVKSALKAIQTFIDVVNSQPLLPMKAEEMHKWLIAITNTGNLRQRCAELYKAALNPNKEPHSPPPQTFSSPQ